ncbi:hypothetical protein [Rhizosaccharibacter radicis]|uniref:Uncharacterized protein n=1 Tax=Rhizosaccharibacter radicis TaxID=2782605 RepID=A0ABT1VYZ8_9PROT|nr:hypothetical protein [Acetobacteraceae bacterium KSS12]
MRRWLLATALAAPGLSLPAIATTMPERTCEVRGSIGPYRIGGALTLSDGERLVAAHYFYVRTLVDIPLQVSMDGDQFVMREPGGGTFRLHLVGNGPAPRPAVPFGQATGLQGTWTGPKGSLPVALIFDWEVSGPFPARRYGDITAETDEAFEKRIRNFIADVLHGRKEQASGFVSCPLRINASHRATIPDRAALVARWTRVFTPDILAALRHAVPHEMFVHEDQVMIGHGEAWFDGTGAVAINHR